jgi:hypothetical protein
MPGFWRKCRITFRWFRLAVWVLVLAALGAFLWFNRVGLPDFLKTRLVAALREQGVDLEFSRMRLSLVRGLVAENVRAGQSSATAGATFRARTVQLELDYSALWQRRLELAGLKLRDGFFGLPLSATNALTLTNLQAELRFGARDTWSFDQLHANFAGAKIDLTGELAHARAALDWKFFSGGTGDRGLAVGSLNDFQLALQKIHFRGEPQLRLKFSGDGRDVHSVTVQLDATADGVLTPWFGAKDFQAMATLTAPATAPTNAEPAWGFWTNLQPFRLAWSVRLGELRSKNLDLDQIAGTGSWSAPKLAASSFSARLGGGNFQAAATLDVPTRQVEFHSDSAFDWHVLGRLLPETTRSPLAKISWTTSPALTAEVSLRLPAWTNNFAWDWQNDLLPALSLHGELAFTNASLAGAPVDFLRTHFHYFDQLWELPDFTVTQGKTRLNVSGQFSGATENFHFLVGGQFAADSVRPFLTTSNAVGGFSHLTATEPLALALDVAGNLRSLQTLTATGRVAITNFAVRGQTLDSVASQLALANGRLQFLHPEISRAGGAQHLTADAVVLDFNQMLLSFTNGYGRMDPMVLTRAIGPKTAHLLEPYQFLRPPLARVNGWLPLRDMNGPNDTEGTDLRFDVLEGVPFHWLRLNATSLTGTIRWLGPELILQDLQAQLYGGSGTGGAHFDFRPPHDGADYEFNLAVTNVNLHQFAADVSSPTNELEGIVAGTLVVTHADTRFLESWDGYGAIQLKDGLLWNIPIFGIISPLLNTFSSGLGNSRATEATANYIITNGVTFSDSLVIHSTMMRLSYTGTVDMQQNVNARVTAHLLRDVWVVGPLVSTMLWPVSKAFECRVTGNLDRPVATPLYIPFSKVLFAPLHPIRSVEELLSPTK